jgi:hypothetical protein
MKLFQSKKRRIQSNLNFVPFLGAGLAIHEDPTGKVTIHVLIPFIELDIIVRPPKKSENTYMP